MKTLVFVTDNCNVIPLKEIVHELLWGEIRPLESIDRVILADKLNKFIESGRTIMRYER